MLQKPFDNNFQTAIVHTANELLNFFNARSVFCCSDEISLVFSSVCSREEYEKLIASNEKNLPVHIYSGRRSKLESLISAKCSVLFNRHMLNEINKSKDTYTQNAIDKISLCDSIFDARVIYIPIGREIEIVNNIIWRSCYDCYRNCISACGRYILGQSICKNKNGQEMITMMKENGFDFLKSVPLSYKYGVFGKKILVNHEILSPIGETVGETVTATRSENYNFCTNLLTKSQNSNNCHISESKNDQPYLPKEFTNEDTIMYSAKALELLISKTFLSDLIETESFLFSDS